MSAHASVGTRPEQACELLVPESSAPSSIDESWKLHLHTHAPSPCGLRFKVSYPTGHIVNITHISAGAHARLCNTQVWYAGRTPGVSIASRLMFIAPGPCAAVVSIHKHTCQHTKEHVHHNRSRQLVQRAHIHSLSLTLSRKYSSTPLTDISHISHLARCCSGA